MVSNIAGMNPCRKCGHDLSEHDVYDGCKHTHWDWLQKRTCICSNFQPMAACNCGRCANRNENNS
jgi:hypothetical protein